MTNKDKTHIPKRLVWRCDEGAELYPMQVIYAMFLSFLLLVGMENLVLAAGESEDSNTHDHSNVVESEQTQPINSYCPVMLGRKVDPEIYSDYKGERVYFCCANCKASFEQNPEKYLALLPQFGGNISHADHDQHNNGSGFALVRLTKPMGVATLSLLILTLLAGVFRRKAPKLLFKWHKRLGVTTVVFAITHAILVVTTH